MRDVKAPRRLLLSLLSFGLAIVACGGDSATSPGAGNKSFNPASCTGIDLGVRPAPLSAGTANSGKLPVLGNGVETGRYTAEIAARANIAYTTTWSFRGSNPGNKINVWDVSGNTPTLIDSVIVSNATTLGDVAVSDDGALLVVATERTGGSIVIFDLADPRHPRLLSRFNNAHTDPGVHTAEIGRVNGKLYGFLSIDPSSTAHARLVIVDLSDPSAPREVFTKEAGNPFVHDTFVRDGLLFVALWDDGMQIWDLGGCGASGGASPENPRVIGGVKTAGGEVHNVWWYHDPSGGKRFAFVGQEGPGAIGSSSIGDIHVVDITDPTQPKEVAFYHVDGAGTHNFSVDEAHGVLYAAYYNGGVRAIDVRGDLASCPNSQQVGSGDGSVRCDLRLMGRELATGLLDAGKPVYVWGVQYLGANVYASDMLNGIWKLSAAK
jgi:hypothetical protein